MARRNQKRSAAKTKVATDESALQTSTIVDKELQTDVKTDEQLTTEVATDQSINLQIPQSVEEELQKTNAKMMEELTAEAIELAVPDKVDEDEEYSDFMHSVWVVVSDIVTKTYSDGSSTTRLKCKYQSKSKGYPKAVLNVWGLDSLTMMDLIDYSKVNPFNLIKLYGDFEIIATDKNPIAKLSDATIALDDKGNWIIQQLDKTKFTREVYAKSVTVKELEEKRRMRAPKVIKEGKSVSQSQINAMQETEADFEAEEQDLIDNI